MPDVDAVLIAGLAGLALGALVAGTLVGWRLARRGAGRRTETPEAAGAGALPEGAADILAVLRSSSVVLDAQDRVVRASSTARALGVVRGEELAVPELLGLVRRVRRAGDVAEAELDVARGTAGARLAVYARVAPLGAAHVLVLVEDRSEARRLDAVRRDFVANVSHELKTPVGALLLLAEAVLGASEDAEAVRRFAGRMQHEAARLSALVQELIDLSRVQGADPIKPGRLVEVDRVVAEAADRCRLVAQAKDIALVTGGESGLRVLGDEGQLVTALRNLVDNAVSYSPEHTRVALGVRRTGDLVEIHVTDQGIGIAQDDLERIFERFYRVDPARSRATGGTGLGLSLVKHIAANHGGEVTVWSVEGSGSTFTLRLPLAAGTAAPAEGTDTHPHPRSGASATPPDPPPAVSRVSEVLQ